MPPVPLGDLPHRDTYCLKEEIAVAGRLVHFLPFWEEIIQEDHSRDSTPRFQGGRNTTSPLEGLQGLQVLSNKVEDLFWKGVIVLNPLDQVRSGY